MTLYRKALPVIAALLAVVPLYVPFRLFAQRFNTVFPADFDAATGKIHGLGDFYHWFSVGVWPTYALLCGFCPMLAARCARARWWLMIPVFIIAFVLWDQITVLDDWLNMPAGGRSGFRSCMANHSGMSTSRLSVVLSPIAVVCGALGGSIAGHIVSKGVGNSKDAEPIAPDGRLNRWPSDVLMSLDCSHPLDAQRRLRRR